MTDAPHVVHSLAEAYLFLMATPCRSCGKGGRKAVKPAFGMDAFQGNELSTEVCCNSCGAVSEERFQLSNPDGADVPEASTPINPSDEPSKVLDAAQWLSLSAVLVESASRERDRSHARQLKIEAGDCISEALKFYDDNENDLPPPEAFFQERSRSRFRDYPDEFSRPRLINMKSKLPRAVNPSDAGACARPVGIRRWWAQEGTP